jgi:Protein of unknown function (DUF1553)/Protein of unknown function (DUF1549)/Planctomycete cytochrome C
MGLFSSYRKWLVLGALGFVLLVLTLGKTRKPIDFSSQVKPILNKKCITCHGGVRRKGGFSVLFRSEALGKTESGKRAIIPGDPDHSELIKRITYTDPEERMPYRHEPLSKEEISLLKQWIKEGAPWGDHWAFVPVRPVQIPMPKSGWFGLVPSRKPDWVINNIDYFIYDKLRQEKLQPSRQADKPTLLRRVSLDLTGLPPSDAMARQFLADSTAGAYEKLVDRLLGSPHFGERWAALWMDLARYADTKGYERDDSRSIWRYRDWLIRAFNNNEPYDRFLTEQIAGDLLPNPSDDQYIATAFHRNTMTNDEGGTDNEEFRTAAVLDRVNTTWEALMGTTFGCVQCHSHPYDPFTHDEYYQFMAFFNDTRDEDTYGDYPLLRTFNERQHLQLDSLTTWVSREASRDQASRINCFLRTWQPSINSLTADKFVNSELADSKWLIFRNHAVARLKAVDLQGARSLIYRFISWNGNGVWTMHLDSPDGLVLASVREKKAEDWTIATVDFPVQSGVHDIYLTYENPQLKKPNESGLQFDWFHFTQEFPGAGRPGHDQYQRMFWALVKASVPTTPVMMDNPADMHRVTQVFERGNWLVKGKVVEPSVPHALNPLPPGAPRNRMGLAMWLVNDQNPLVSRALVNRLWEQLFGTGLVETLEDLGTQGAAPSHQELLDYLAWTFMHEDKWNIKMILKEMVMSATYRQDSKVSPDALQKDPFNKWYARGSRVRLSAEQVRDQALAVSGLLSEKMYGPSVMPYQPKGIWLSPWNGQDWVASGGEDQYRRALYTYWKRTAPYPSMITFDGASREVCIARRIRTNTPLQALVTLNDEVYVDAARHFAYRMEREARKGDVADQISQGYQMALHAPISAAKLEVLERLYAEALQKFQGDPDRTCEMIGVMDEHNNPQTASLVVVANVMLNLDELITKN